MTHRVFKIIKAPNKFLVKSKKSNQYWGGIGWTPEAKNAVRYSTPERAQSAMARKHGTGIYDKIIIAMQ